MLWVCALPPEASLCLWTALGFRGADVHPAPQPYKDAGPCFPRLHVPSTTPLQHSRGLMPALSRVSSAGMVGQSSDGIQQPCPLPCWEEAYERRGKWGGMAILA